MDTNTPTDTRLNLTLPQVEERINTLVRQGNLDTHEIGRLYNYVVENKLAKKPQYKNAQDFFKKRVKGLSQSALSMYGTVARQFSAEHCGQFGMNNLYVLLTYEKLSGTKVDVKDPGPTPITVPQEDGEPVQKPFAECTVEELKLAVQYKRSPPAPGIPTTGMVRLQRYHDTLARFFPENALVRLNARLHRDQILLSVKDVPEAELEQLAEALLECLNPAREAA